MDIFLNQPAAACLIPRGQNDKQLLYNCGTGTCSVIKDPTVYCAFIFGVLGAKCMEPKRRGNGLLCGAKLQAISTCPNGDKPSAALSILSMGGSGHISVAFRATGKLLFKGSGWAAVSGICGVTPPLPHWRPLVSQIQKRFFPNTTVSCVWGIESECCVFFFTFCSGLLLNFSCSVPASFNFKSKAAAVRQPESEITNQ